jgi:uncharacterized repeat protein (TIGR03803 family)
MKILRIPLLIVLVVAAAGQAFDAMAQTETMLYSFGSVPNDGFSPSAVLVQGSDGNFYGTTVYGGTSGSGTVFRISPSGTYTTLYSFVGYPTDGAYPRAGLVQGSNGNLYGTTEYGGTSTNSRCSGGCGTVFRISPSGIYTSLYSFVGYPTDGYEPYAELMQGSDGNLYGTAIEGGLYNIGTVFRISPSGTYTNIYTFSGLFGIATNGAFPQARLMQGTDGNFYGTTVGGGTSTDYNPQDGDFGVGTVFRISPSGTETALYSFVGSPNDGANPQVGLVQGSDGNFYGTTYYGGTSTNCGPYGCGTVFRTSPSGSETNLHSFPSSPTDGSEPYTGLMQGSDGNFYGTTAGGGTNGVGTVFRISPSGTYTTLYQFVGYPTDGANPSAGLVQGSDGNFYGTTAGGGTNGVGTVFKLIVPLTPPPYPINQITSFHRASTNVVFTIPSIAGETYQLQFSSSMSPTNWVNVPGVSVTNSIGALLSLTNFGGASQPQGFYRFDITP